MNQAARSFSPNVEWYGNTRGSDGIFSFHPFASESISHNGTQLPVSFRPSLIKAGLLEKFHSERHPADLYFTLKQYRE